MKRYVAKKLWQNHQVWIVEELDEEQFMNSQDGLLVGLFNSEREALDLIAAIQRRASRGDLHDQMPA